MPGFAPTEPRRRVALAALALPILAMIGLFGWAGGAGSPSPTTVVNSFVTAFNTHDCKTMTADLYHQKGTAALTCSQLIGNGKTKLLGCKLSKETSAAVLATAKPPSGYGDASTVRAACKETLSTTSGKTPKSQPLTLDILVATSSSSGLQQIIKLQIAP